ncbi:MAG: type II toxin-antitoxin system RelE/ParE family toxin [Alphaproteobacteria bacterium]|nr:MAG: type II toxin-antitoxin system RelE/ParE family toxin [Alphaproteobacteria bacterium]
MDSEYKIYWTDEAISNLESILDYLKNYWTQREINNFKKKLGKQVKLIENNPKLFPVSRNNCRLRKAVLSKQTTIFYELSGQMIYLVYLFNTRQSPKKIK